MSSIKTTNMEWNTKAEVIGLYDGKEEENPPNSQTYPNVACERATDNINVAFRTSDKLN